MRVTLCPFAVSPFRGGLVEKYLAANPQTSETAFFATPSFPLLAFFHPLSSPVSRIARAKPSAISPSIRLFGFLLTRPLSFIIADGSLGGLVHPYSSTCRVSSNLALLD
ncbi:hypothetical protein VTI28DRAFT_8727 [Corynascus sepedonium]